MYLNFSDINNTAIPSSIWNLMIIWLGRVRFEFHFLMIYTNKDTT